MMHCSHHAVFACRPLDAENTLTCAESPQIGTVSDEGVSISAPFYLDDKWDHEGYHLAEHGSVHFEPDEDMPQQSDPQIWQAMQEEMVEVFCPWHSDDDLSESE